MPCSATASAGRSSGGDDGIDGCVAELDAGIWSPARAVRNP
jgi:hypothetical protein